MNADKTAGPSAAPAPGVQRATAAPRLNIAIDRLSIDAGSASVHGDRLGAQIQQAISAALGSPEFAARLAAGSSREISLPSLTLPSLPAHATEARIAQAVAAALRRALPEGG